MFPKCVRSYASVGRSPTKLKLAEDFIRVTRRCPCGISPQNIHAKLNVKHFASGILRVKFSACHERELVDRSEFTVQVQQQQRLRTHVLVEAYPLIVLGIAEYPETRRNSRATTVCVYVYLTWEQENVYSGVIPRRSNLHQQT
jgi:hypothetical protein